MSVYEFSAIRMDGGEQSLAAYEGKVLIIVNTATKCGFTPQLKELQSLQEKYDGKLIVLGFPCNQFMNQEPGTNEEVAEACQLNYGVTFPLFQKINVNGKQAHPLFQYLKSEAKGLMSKDIKWNFTKFLIDQNGEVINRYAPSTTPAKMEEDIKKLLQEEA
ncbi:glutathione peroxidase [Evansella cellulosilytica]|uniref:Glutathione peroxidase n=1 Tax=Evansella cellulosilytica (strain ATCC 21833 / DSM 2522 / FERM P-1141 / JCM 9156 / N-4) TaxID=649639 RepID=E6U0S9_EVAC2|nr:glutathione peroxidase [Evansella cellulosilytica]ADU29127.1 Peroxiredoxin [Evansella cellulosilytica DSM 2522]